MLRAGQARELPLTLLLMTLLAFWLESGCARRRIEAWEPLRKPEAAMLCAKAKAASKSKTVPRIADSTPCIFLGAGGNPPPYDNGLKCKYNCGGIKVEMLKTEPRSYECPGDDTADNLIEWAKIKMLRFLQVLE